MNLEELRNKATYSKQVVDYNDWQIALTWRFRAMKVWIVLRSCGVENLRNFMRGDVKMAKHFKGLVGMDFEIVVRGISLWSVLGFHHRQLAIRLQLQVIKTVLLTR